MPSMWKRAMVYLGLADDEEYVDYGDYEESEAAPRQPASGHGGGYQPSSPYPADQAGTVRTLSRDEAQYAPSRPEAQQPMPHSSAVRTLPPQREAQRLHYAEPKEFISGAKEVGDRFKAQAPVIMNLSGTEKVIARRLLDYASGLAYGLSGSLKKVGENVFLLTPTGVEVSAEEKRRLRDSGILFEE